MSGASGLRKHGHLTDGDGGAITTHTVYAEMNTTPIGPVNIPWDTFYDVNQADTSGVIPAGVGLSYASATFTALEDGVWVLNMGVDLNAAPGHTGDLTLAVPNYGYSSRIDLLASGNVSKWRVERTVVMHAGDTFLVAHNADVGDALTDGYAVLEIHRIAKAVA